LNKATRTH